MAVLLCLLIATLLLFIIAVVLWNHGRPVSPLQQYRDHLSGVYLDEPEVHQSILPKEGVLFVEPVLEQVEKFSSSSSSLDMSVKGDLDTSTYGIIKTNLSQLFNTPIGHGHRTFIRGHPGSGKTTLLKQLTKSWATAVQTNLYNKDDLSGCMVLLLVYLRDFWTYPNPRNITKLDLFTVIGSEPYVEYNWSKVLAAVLEDQLCIFLDGLDEYAPGHTEHYNFIHKIVSGKALKKATVFVTSRPEAISALPRSYRIFARVEILGFDWSRIETFVKSYYETSASEDKANKILEYLREKKVVRFMCYVPIYLHMLIYVYDENMKLPVTPTEIFASFTLQTLREELKNIDESLLLPSHDECLNLTIHYIDLTKCNELLAHRFAAICRLAYDGIYNVIDDPLASERPSVVAQFSKKVVPADLHNHSLGLLFSHQIVKPLGAIERVYTFQHLTLQQFLAAYHLSQLALKHQVDLITHPYFPGNVSNFFCGLYSFAVRNESMLFNVIDHLLNDIYVDSLPLAAQCVFESQHSSAASELLRHSRGQIALRCVHYETVVLSSPTMTKVNLVPFDESFFQVAMEYIFAQAHGSISGLEIADICSCPNIKWHEVVSAAPSLSFLSVISLEYCSLQAVPIYLDSFSVALSKAPHLKKIKVSQWPANFREGIFEQVRAHSIGSDLTELEFVCHFEEILSMDQLIGILSDTICTLPQVKQISVHCATNSVIKLKRSFDVHQFLYQLITGVKACTNQIMQTFQHLDARPFFASSSPGDRHCHSWCVNVLEKVASIEICGNRFLDAIEWIIDAEIL